MVGSDGAPGADDSGPPHAVPAPLRYALVVNEAGGTARKKGWSEDAVASLFTGAGLEAFVVAADGRSLDERLRAARDSGADIVVVGGGDGSVAAAAQILAGTGMPLAILPLGTANLVARDLLLPLDPAQAVAQLPAFRPRAIDIAEMNGRVFLSKAMLGLSPALAGARHRARRKGRKELLGRLKHIGGFLKAVGRSRRLDVEIDWGEGPRKLKTPALAIGNNSYDEGFGRIFARSRLDDGLLTIYAGKELSALRVARILVRMALGRWKHDPEIFVREASEVTLSSGSRLLHVTLDGEVLKAVPPLRFRIRPRALVVLAPAVAAR